MQDVLAELSKHQLPTQSVRIQVRVLKRARARFPHKRPEHFRAPPLELDLDFQQIIVLVL